MSKNYPKLKTTTLWDFSTIKLWGWDALGMGKVLVPGGVTNVER